MRRRETTRRVNPGDYSIGIAVGFQPETIQALLSDEESASWDAAAILAVYERYRS